MTKYFFDINAPEVAASLFAHSKLAKEDPDFITRHCGQFPVIFVSFGGARATTWEEMRVKIIDLISTVYYQHEYLLATDGFLTGPKRKEFLATLEKDPSVVFEFALRKLTELLHRYHKKRVIVLIDEYDKPVNEAFENGYYKEALAFLVPAFTGCLKDNPYSFISFSSAPKM